MGLTVGFIGCGNMGGALARAAAKSAVAERILLFDACKEKAAMLAEEIGAEAVSNDIIAREAQLIFLGVKPNMLSTVAKELGKALRENPEGAIVSMLAGVSLGKLKSAFEDVGAENAIIRIMPNTPVAVGEGMITYCCENCPAAEDAFLGLMAYAGRLDKVDESKIDAASAVAGCGPAFAYMFIEALADGAVECGLTRDKAILYAAATLKGAAEMVLESGEHPDVLKDRVCSPGGSTIEGVHALENGAFRATAMNAVVKAYEKTKKLG